MVKLELKDASLDLLKKALESLGYRVYDQTEQELKWIGGRYNKADGKLTISDVTTGNAIRRGYTAELVKKQATRFGWQIKKTGENKFAIIKR
jgi:hypothetical protein